MDRFLWVNPTHEAVLVSLPDDQPAHLCRPLRGESPLLVALRYRLPLHGLAPSARRRLEAFLELRRHGLLHAHDIFFAEIAPDTPAAAVAPPGRYLFVVEPARAVCLERVLQDAPAARLAGMRSVLASLAAALAILHGHGQAYGQLSPRHVFVLGDRVGVRILDPFLEGGAGDAVGDPDRAYLPPESVLGIHHPSPPADLFALGCIVAEALAGLTAPLFASVDASDQILRMLAVIGLPPPAGAPYLSADAYARLAATQHRYAGLPDVGGGPVRELVSALVSFAPSDRPAASVVAERLASLADPLPVAAEPEPAPEPAPLSPEHETSDTDLVIELLNSSGQSDDLLAGHPAVAPAESPPTTVNTRRVVKVRDFNVHFPFDLEGGAPSRAFLRTAPPGPASTSSADAPVAETMQLSLALPAGSRVVELYGRWPDRELLLARTTVSAESSTAPMRTSLGVQVATLVVEHLEDPEVEALRALRASLQALQ